MPAYHDILVGVCATAPKAGKTTFCEVAMEHMPDLRHAESSETARRLHDERHGTNTLGNLEDKYLHRERVGQIADEIRGMDPHGMIKGVVVGGHLNLLVSGLRHPAEAEYIRQLGGWVVRIETSLDTNRARLTPEQFETWQHKQASDRERVMENLPMHFVLHNDGSREAFEAKVRTALEEMRRLGTPPADWQGKEL